MENLAKKTFWRDAVRGGLAVGLLVVFFDYLSALFATPGGRVAMVLSILGIGAMAYFIFLFTRRHGEMFAERGFSFGQSMGFIVAMMLFAGLVWGLGYYFLYNHIRPELLVEMVEAMLEALESSGNYDMLEMAEKMGYKLYGSFIFMMFSGLIRMVVIGSIVGLFVAPFTKRLPEPRMPEDNYDGDEQ